MAACPSCGRDNADDARFCSACGAELAVAPDSPSAVDPTRSQKSTVTTLRASRCVGKPEEAARHATTALGILEAKGDLMLAARVRERLAAAGVRTSEPVI